MNQPLLLATLTLLAISALTSGLDTIFAKGGTCMYKIRKPYDACMESQKARLIRDRDTLEPIYTHAAMIASTNRISCCAFWAFLDCVYEAAEEHCPGDKRDMEAYVAQLGSAVPVQDCIDQFPRDSPLCEGLGRGGAAATGNSRGGLTLLLIISALLVGLVIF